MLKKIPAVLLLASVFTVFQAASVYGNASDESGPVKLRKITDVRLKDKNIIITNDKKEKIKYRIKGVCYAFSYVDGDTYYKNYKKDIPLMKKIGANSARTYRPLAYFENGVLDADRLREMLDAFYKAGITLAVGFSYEDMGNDDILERYLIEFGKHPAILMFVFGNEYNYHYDEWFTKDEWFYRLGAAAEKTKRFAPGKISAAVHGEMPSKEELGEYTEAGINLVMLNMYRGSNFGFAAEDWYETAGDIPWVIGEFGRSSKDAQGADTSNMQASYLQSLIKSMESGYLFCLCDDPGKGDGQISDVIGREDSLGVFDKKRKAKKSAAAVRAEYDKITGAQYVD